MKTGLSKYNAITHAKESLGIAIDLAKEASNGLAKVLGSIAPAEDCYRPDLFPGKDVIYNEIKQIADWMSEKSIDGFLIETMNNLSEAEICIRAISDYATPVWISFNLATSSTLLSGEKLEKVFEMVNKYNIECLMINCTPLDRTLKSIYILSNNYSGQWGIYPNLGLGEPSPDGIITSVYSDEKFINLIDTALTNGANVLGGCCGVSPRHIQMIYNRTI